MLKELMAYLPLAPNNQMNRRSVRVRCRLSISVFKQDLNAIRYNSYNHRERKPEQKHFKNLLENCVFLVLCCFCRSMEISKGEGGGRMWAARDEIFVSQEVKLINQF